MTSTQIQESGGGLRICGPLRFDSVATLREAGIRLIRDGARVVDLGAVERADSSALALLMEWERAAAGVGGSLKFVSVPEQLRQIASLSEMDQVLDLNP